MVQAVTLNAERRRDTGKGAARQLRQRGKIPAVIYGHGRTSEALALDAVEFEKALQGIAGGSTLIDLAVEGKPVRTLIREIQRHPTRLNITHVDFYEIHAGEKITLAVPLKLVGSPEGVRSSGGVLEVFLREIEIEVLPKDIPERIELDVSALTIGHSLHIRDLSVAKGEVLADIDATICTVVPPRVEEEVVPAEVVEEEEAAEPELIRKPKAEEGEEEAESTEPEE